MNLKTKGGNARNRGFTLVEVMVTTSIVALLVATVVPSYKNYILRAEITEGLTFLGSKKNEIHDYFGINDRMPRYLEDIGWPSNKSPNPGLSNTYKVVFGGKSKIWSRVGVNSSGRKGKNQYVDMYLRTQRLEQLNNKRGFLYIQAKGADGGVEFRCSVSRTEMMSIVPSSCATIRGKFAKW